MRMYTWANIELLFGTELAHLQDSSKAGGRYTYKFNRVERYQHYPPLHRTRPCYMQSIRVVHTMHVLLLSCTAYASTMCGSGHISTKLHSIIH